MPFQKYSAILVATSLLAGAGLQSAAAAELEEIVVTATKRASTLQEIPMSITALSGESLERAGVTDFTDIATSVPAVSFRSSGPGRTKLNVRGVSAATGVAPTVSFYIDEMPIQTISSGSTTSFAQAIVDPKMFDLERVEVLRGPQGTLYGSSSMGGTIRLITRQPEIGEFDGRVATEISSTNEGGTNYRVDGMINAPLGETAALRIVGSYSDNDGYFDRVNVATGETFAEDVNTEETASIRAALRWEITENAYIQPYVFKQMTDMDGKPNFDGPCDKVDQPRAWPGAEGTCTEQLSIFDAPEPFEDEFTLTSFTYGHDFESMSLLATWSQIDREFTNREDITEVGGLFASPNPLPSPAYSDEFVDLEDETIELRLVSTSDSAWQWLVGYYRKEAVSDAGYRMQEGWDFFFPGDDIGLANTQKLQDYEEDAFFGELTYNFNDAWSVTAGVRSLDYDFRSREENWGGAFTGGNRSTANVRDEVISQSETHGKLALTYAFGEGNQVYVSAATGTRPGGVNRVIPTSDDPAEPVGYACQQDLIRLGLDDEASLADLETFSGDEVTNTEFGWKLLFGESVRVNGAVYMIKWDNVQQQLVPSGTCGNYPTENFGEAQSTGLELEVSAAVTDNLTLGGSVGVIDADFRETVPATDITRGDLLADVPKITFNLSADWAIPTSNGEFFVLGDYNYVDETLELPGKPYDFVIFAGIDSGNVRPSYHIFDLRLGYASEAGWEASMFVENLFDEIALYGYNDAIAFACSEDSCGTPWDPTVRNRPRTIGIALSYDFQ